jgi:hypothetical protein
MRQKTNLKRVIPAVTLNNGVHTGEWKRGRVAKVSEIDGRCCRDRRKTRISWSNGWMDSVGMDSVYVLGNPNDGNTPGAGAEPTRGGSLSSEHTVTKNVRAYRRCASLLPSQ